MTTTETNLRNELARLAATRVLCTQRAEWNKITRAMNALTRKLNDVILEGEVARVNAACEAHTPPRSTPKDESGKPSGSVMAAGRTWGPLPKLVQEYKDWKAKGFPDGFGGQSAKEAARHRMKHGIGEL